LLSRNLLVSLAGDNIDVFRRTNFGKTIIRLLDEGLSFTEDIKELLWGCTIAEGPKACTHATGHDDTIIIGVYHIFVFYCCGVGGY
jgi:hypothetical protein